MKISELNLAGAIVGTEVFPIVQGGETKKVSIADALAGAGSGSTGVNGLNGTANIGLGGTLLNDTTIDGVGGGYSILFEGIQKYKIDSSVTEFLTGGTFKVFSATDPLTILGYHDVISNAITCGFLIDLGGVIKSQFTGIDIGLKLDFVNNQYFFGGNPGVNGSTFIVDNFNGFISIKGPSSDTTALNFDMVGQIYEFGDILGGIGKLTIKPNDANFARGLSMVFDNINVKLGDYNTSGNSTLLEVDDFNKIIKTTSRGDEIGFNLDFTSDIYLFGDYNNNDYLSINKNNSNTILKAGNSIVLYQGRAGLNLQNGVSILCDPDGNGNSSYFGLDDINQTVYGSANLITTNNGTPVNEHLKINLGGTDYVIQLRLA